MPAAGGDATTVAQVGDVFALAYDGTSFFFLGDAVMQLPPGGGPLTRISDPCFYPNVLAVDATRAFWACQDGTVRAVDKAGGPSTSTKLYARGGGGNIGGLVLDDANVYFTSMSDNAVDRVAKTGGPVTTLATVASPGPIAVDDAFVYYGVRGKTGAAHTLERVAKQ